jgi:hypothetical protein
MYVIVNSVGAKLRNNKSLYFIIRTLFNTYGENRSIEEMKATKPHSNFRVDYPLLELKHFLSLSR